MAFATQRPLLPMPSYNTDTSLSVLQSSALSLPRPHTMDTIRATLLVFGSNGQEIDRGANLGDTTKCESPALGEH